LGHLLFYTIARHGVGRHVMSEEKQTICLIIPPSIFLLDERVFVSLGVLKVAAVLEQAGKIVELLDLSGIENFEDALADHIKTSRAKNIWGHIHHAADAGGFQNC